MAATARNGSVQFSAYSLEVDGGEGSYAHYLAADEHEDQSALRTADEQENQGRLGAALDEKPREPAKLVAAIEEFQESADAVTAKVEQADQLLKAARTGQLLELSNVNSEIDALLDLFGRLDRAGRFEEELRLMRSLNGLLALALRWFDLIRSLRSLLRSAETVGHAAGQAFAHHELGSLCLCAGQPEKAVKHLREAERLQKQLGDPSGSCATRHNLDSAERDLAHQLSGGSQPPTRLQRLLVLVGAAAIAAAGGAGIALAVHHPHTNPPPTMPTTTSTQPNSQVVAVLLAGSGKGSVTGPGLDCPRKECSDSIKQGQEITLNASPGKGSHFTRWLGVDQCGRSKACKFTVNGDVTVAATFSAHKSTPQTPQLDAPTHLQVTSSTATEVDLSWQPSASMPSSGYYVISRDSQELAPVFGDTTAYRDPHVSPSTRYEYRVRAIAGGWKDSPNSAPTLATTLPSAPTYPMATYSLKTDAIELIWTPPTDRYVTGYLIDRGTDKTVLPTTPVPNTPMPVGLDSGLASNPFLDANFDHSVAQTLYYTVVAVDKFGGKSEPSNVTSATTPNG